MLVERAMVNRTEAQAVGDRGCALDQCVPSDVGGIEKAHLSQSADSAAVPVRRQHDRAKATLVQTYFDLPCRVAPRDLIEDRNGFALVNRANYRARGDENGAGRRIVGDDVSRI